MGHHLRAFIGYLMAADELDDAAFSAAVGALERYPVPLLDEKADMAADRRISIGDGNILQFHQPVGMEGCLKDF